MIRKVINSHDIHVDGQQLRIVQKDELTGSVEGFNNIDLLLNEPRGSKYVNLIIYKSDESAIDVEIYSNSVLDNKDILLKSFIRSLLERGTINKDDSYVIKEKGETYTYPHDSLGIEKIYEVEGVDGVYVVNGKNVLVETVDFELTIENITEIKNYIDAYKVFKGYLVLMNGDGHITVNEEKVVLAYPVSEAVSVLNCIYKKEKIIALNTAEVEIVSGQYSFEHYLISNSQFYIEGSDIYSKGFIIK